MDGTDAEDDIETTHAKDIYLNKDDDNENSRSDYSDSHVDYLNPSEGINFHDDDFAEVQLAAEDLPDGEFELRLTVPAGIKVWSDTQKSTVASDQLQLSGTSTILIWTSESFPTSVYAEGVSVGNHTLSWDLNTETDGSVASDSVLADVIQGANTAPEFELDAYNVKLGRQTGKDDTLYHFEEDGTRKRVTKAYDAEGDELEYSITSGNDGGHFKINASTGKVQLTGNAIDLSQSTYTLGVKVEEKNGTLSDTATVNLTLVDTVGIGGDTHATEGGSDKFEVRFVRYVDDPSASLTASYKIEWISAAESDIDDTLDKNTFLNTTVEFPANVTEVVYQLEAKNDFQAEPIESFRVEVLDGDNYDPVTSSGDDKDKKNPGLETYRSLLFEIADLWTLFGKQSFSDLDNDGTVDTGETAVVDDVNNDGELNAADMSHANPGIHFNDIDQGGVGDCVCMAALIMLVQENWQIIEDRFEDVGDAFTVTLFDDTGTLHSYTVEKDFIRGADMADLSGDVDAPLGSHNVYAEVWPMVAEAAFAQHVEGFDNIEPTDPGEIWKALTGKTVRGPILFGSGVPTSDIQSELNAGNQVYLGSRYEANGLPENQDGMVFGGPDIVGPHAYVVLDIYEGDVDGDGPRGTETIYKLRNPWGVTQLIPEEFIDDLFYRYFVFESVD